MENQNKNFVKETGLGIGGIIFMVIAAVAIFGLMGYFLIAHGDFFALPRPGQ